MTRWIQQSATALAAAIRKREISSRQLLEAYISQIERVNPQLHALVKDRFNEARQEADQADQQLQAMAPETLPPFYGVPFSVKETIRVKGMPNSAGLVARKDVVATEDATVVSRMRKAGFIPLGVTNIPELAMWMETFNPLYGRTHNPYDLRRTAGGSSGGEAALITACGAAVGIGNDIGGSLRMPAFFNGIFAHKATGGLIPNGGQFPPVAEAASPFLSVGPLTRHAEDLMPLVKILAGPDGIDQACRPMSIGDPKTVRLHSVQVINVRSNGSVAVVSDLQRSQQAVVDYLRTLGAGVVERNFERLRQSFFVWNNMVAIANGRKAFSALVRSGKGWRLSRELMKSMVGRSNHTLPILGLCLLEAIDRRPQATVEKAAAEGLRLKEELIETIGENGVILFPSFSRTAPRHISPAAMQVHATATLLLSVMPFLATDRAPFPMPLPLHTSYTSIFNVLQFPVTQVPLGLNAQGLPMGIQVVSRPGNDHLTIAVAQALEKRFGGWIAPRRWV